MYFGVGQSVHHRNNNPRFFKIHLKWVNSTIFFDESSFHLLSRKELCRQISIEARNSLFTIQTVLPSRSTILQTADRLSEKTNFGSDNTAWKGEQEFLTLIKSLVKPNCVSIEIVLSSTSSNYVCPYQSYEYSFSLQLTYGYKRGQIGKKCQLHSKDLRDLGEYIRLQSK